METSKVFFTLKTSEVSLIHTVIKFSTTSLICFHSMKPNQNQF